MGYALRKSSTKKMAEIAFRTLGYARVSTVGQTLAAQLDQLRAAGCRPIFQEKTSGAKADRKQLAVMLRGLQAGDVVTVTASTGWRARCSTCSPS